MMKDQKDRREMRKAIVKGLADVLALYSQTDKDLKGIAQQLSQSGSMRVASLLRYECWSENAVGEPISCDIQASTENASNHQLRTVLKAIAPIEKAMEEVHAILLTLLPGEAIKLRYEHLSNRVTLFLNGTNLLAAAPASWLKNLPLIEAISSQGADLRPFLVDSFGHDGTSANFRPRFIIHAKDLPQAILRSALAASSLKDRTKANFRVPTIFGAAELVAPEIHVSGTGTPLSAAQRASIADAWNTLSNHLHTKPGFEYSLTLDLIIARGKVTSTKLEPVTSPLIAQSDLDAWLNDLEDRMAAAKPFAELLGGHVRSGEIKLSTWMTPRACRTTVSHDDVIFEDLPSLIDQLALRGDATMKNYAQYTQNGLTLSKGFYPQGNGQVYELACATMEELATAQTEAKARIDTFFA